MYCKKCGREHYPGERFCRYCGNDLNAQNAGGYNPQAEYVNFICDRCGSQWKLPAEKTYGKTLLCPFCGAIKGDTSQGMKNGQPPMPQPPMPQPPASKKARFTNKQITLTIVGSILGILLLIGIAVENKYEKPDTNGTGGYSQNYSYSEDTPKNDDVNSVPCVPAESSDFTTLEKMDIPWLGYPRETGFHEDFTYNSITTQYAFEQDIAGLDWSLYNYHFNNGKEQFHDKVPAENVEWIMKNVLNMPVITRNYKSDYSYYSDGYYYYTREVNVIPPKYDVEIISKEKRDNNLYSIILKCKSDDMQDTTTQLTAGVKEVDGKRIWSFYTIIRSNSSGELPTQQSTTKKVETTKAATKKSSSSDLTPTDAEWNEFKNTIIKKAWINELWAFQANYEDHSTRGYLANSFFTLGTGESLIYNYYFNDGKRISYSSQKDPLDRFGNNIHIDRTDGRYYYKYKKENVDWIVKNVMNMTPEQVDHLGDDWFGASCNYYYNGYYYCVESDSAPNMIRDSGFYFKSKTDLGNGKYKVVLGVYDSTLSEITVGIKNVNGKRIWSLYSVTPIYSEAH